MNANLNLLHPYPFEKLAQLKADIIPPSQPHIALSIGEPKHTPPAFALETLATHVQTLAQYPKTQGLPELRSAIATWASRRFNLTPALNPHTHILPVNGTREALFAFTQACVNNKPNVKVLMPNPFYQIYEGAAFLAGAEPVFLNTTAQTGFIPDFDAVSEQTWQDCQLLFICNPGNPTGAVMNQAQYTKLINLALKYDFILASDECYSELYFDEQTPPIGLLEACQSMGNIQFKNCVVFHSLSKRSNLPGLRSGFVAGDEQAIAEFLKYRTYHGCAMSTPTQLASISAWEDEAHVKQNRDLYRAKFQAVIDILQPTIEVQKPDAGFYLWIKTPISDTDFAQQLFATQNVTVLPGSYLSRESDGINPGSGYVRAALVATLDECVEAANRIRTFCQSIQQG